MECRVSLEIRRYLQKDLVLMPVKGPRPHLQGLYILKKGEDVFLPLSVLTHKLVPWVGFLPRIRLP